MKIRVIRDTDSRGTFYYAYGEKPWGWAYISSSMVKARDNDTEEMLVEEVKRKAKDSESGSSVITEVEI